MIKNYLKVALKVLARRKFFTFISLVGISLTLLVLMVATALLDHTLAPHAPETRSDRTLGIYDLVMRGPNVSMSSEPGYGFLDRYIRPLKSLPQVEDVSLASTAEPVSSYLGGRKIESKLKRTDGQFWRILDFRFLEGGPLTSEDERNARYVAVISESTRQRFFGGKPALGRTLEADGQRFRVVGVVPDVPSLRHFSAADLWVPISTTKSKSYRDEWMGGFIALILARSSADFPGIKAEVQARLRAAERNLPDPKTYKELWGSADTLFEAAARQAFPGDQSQVQPGRVRLVLLLLMLLFMLLPTLNLVNINLSRILDRASEIGVRKAFGASSRTLVGQFIIENLVLTLIGAGFGLVLAALVLQALNASGLIPYAQLTLNLRIFVYGLAIALLFGVLSGVYPAWRMSKLHPVQALRGRPA
jgi:putative ABC transport system permease protein